MTILRFYRLIHHQHNAKDSIFRNKQYHFIFSSFFPVILVVEIIEIDLKI